MKKVYHYCLSSPDEVIFRSEEDFIRGFNFYALALMRTESVSLADVFMSNHVHFIIETKDITAFSFAFRHSLAKSLNYKYGRKGTIGERNAFYQEICGSRHLMAAISYVLRNPVHHGITPLPFWYRYSSANIIFKEQLGHSFLNNVQFKKGTKKFLPKNWALPPNLRIDSSGMLIREQFSAVNQVELIYVTPRNFIFQMTRVTDSNWAAEQEEDKNDTSPVTLANFEKSFSTDAYETMLYNEKGRSDYRKIQDTELCSKIDTLVKTLCKKRSVYFLTPDEKLRISKNLTRKKHIPHTQLQRCLLIE